MRHKVLRRVRIVANAIHDRAKVQENFKGRIHASSRLLARSFTASHAVGADLWGL